MELETYLKNEWEEEINVCQRCQRIMTTVGEASPSFSGPLIGDILGTLADSSRELDAQIGNVSLAISLSVPLVLLDSALAVILGIRIRQARLAINI